VVLRVEDFVLDALLGEQPGEVLALLDADRADQNRLTARVAFGDVSTTWANLAVSFL